MYVCMYVYIYIYLRCISNLYVVYTICVYDESCDPSKIASSHWWCQGIASPRSQVPVVSGSVARGAAFFSNAQMVPTSCNARDV